MDRKVLVLPLRAARIPVGTTSYYNFASRAVASFFFSERDGERPAG